MSLNFRKTPNKYEQGVSKQGAQQPESKALPIQIPVSQNMFSVKSSHHCHLKSIFFNHHLMESSKKKSWRATLEE